MLHEKYLSLLFFPQAKKLIDRTEKVARSYWWKNVELIFAIIVIVLLIANVIVLLAVGVIPINAPVATGVTPPTRS